MELPVSREGSGEKVELARGLRHKPSLKMKRGMKGWRELMEKLWGTAAFIPARGVRLVDGAHADAIPKKCGGQ